MKIGHIQSFFGPITLCSLNEHITHLHFGLSLDFFPNSTSAGNLGVGSGNESSCTSMYTPVLRSDRRTNSLAEVSLERSLFYQNIVQDDEQALSLFSQFLKGDSTLVKFIQGTPFQQKVWHSLLEIPYGQTKTYQDIARAIGHPKAFRAVGQAISANPIALVVPCHRIILKTGEIGGYRWGIKIKKALLEHEQTKPKTDLFSLFFRPHT